MKGTRTRMWLRVLAPVLASIVGLTSLRLLGPDILDQQTLSRFLAPLGAFAPAVFILLLTLRPITLLPGQVFAAVGGILFGVVMGTVYALVGSLLAAAMVFFLSRRFGTRFMRRVTGGHYEALIQVARRHDFKVLVLATLNPLVPTDVVIAIAGASGARFWPTTAGVLTGTIPGTVLTVQFGSALSQGKTALTLLAAAGMVVSMVLGVLLGRRVVSDFGAARREIHARRHGGVHHRPGHHRHLTEADAGGTPS
ncbi:MAG: TVP38/TMEM64 family protein [Myxococcaceae bacterium]